MASSLPVLAAFRNVAVRRYLAYDADEREGGNMWYTSREVVKPTTKFAIERSSKDSELVHIRCCYNNKYLAKESQSSNWIDAMAEIAEEDATLWSCTLFRPISFLSGRVQFLHLQSGSFIGSDVNDPRLRIFLNSNPTDIHNNYLVDITDWDSLVILPDRISFKGDNGKYLTPVRLTSSMGWAPPPWFPYPVTHVFQFSSDDDADAGLPHRIFYSDDGRIIIGNIQLGEALTWEFPFNNVPIITKNPRLSSDRPFRAVQIGDNTIALDAWGGPHVYLERNSEDNDILYMLVERSSIVREARFEIGEPVLSRQISNANYRFADARIYDETPVVMVTSSTDNTTQDTHMRTVSFRFTDKSESSWSGFHSVNVGIQMRFRAGIPLIKDFRVEIGGTYDYQYEWGSIETRSESHSDEYTFPVPPMTHVEARLLGTKGKCDVPFSYTVRDLLTDGTVRIYEVDGGVYTGVNHFNFVRQTTSYPIQLSRTNDDEPSSVSEP